MQNKLMITTVVVALVGFAASVQANPITGTVNMAGNVTFDTSSMLTVSAASFVNPAAVVSGGTGSFSTVPIFTTPVDFFGFNIATGDQGVSPLWQFTVAGNVYEFDLSTITSVVRSATDLQVKGLGTISITGDTTENANWNFDVTDSSGGNSGTFKFGFSDSNTSVPDGGATVILLGLGLGVCGVFARKLKLA